jgi:exoribonuclease R
VAANGVMARTLSAAGVSSIRRVVKTPERWQRIVDLAERCGEKLPGDPDSGALNAFLQKRKKVDPVHYADLSLAVVKLMGPGEYVLQRAGGAPQGHFALAARDYTHSTAPNRRFADTVTQRLIKSVIGKTPPPYSDSQLSAIATNCTLKEDAARKVERSVRKIAAAMLFSNRIGEHFKAIVTGNNASGTFVRLVGPPVEGMLVRGQKGVDVGDEIDVQLLSTNVKKGFIDFGRVGDTPTPNPPGKRKTR